MIADPRINPGRNMGRNGSFEVGHDMANGYGVKCIGIVVVYIYSFSNMGRRKRRVCEEGALWALYPYLSYQERRKNAAFDFSTRLFLSVVQKSVAHRRVTVAEVKCRVCAESV